jgi:uncharacterized membrane protein YccC
MWLYSIYDWFDDVFFRSHVTPTALLWVSLALVVILPFVWRRWWAFTAVALILSAMNLLAYHGVMMYAFDRERAQKWLDIPVATVVALALVTTGLQWRYGDRPRRR